MPASTDAPLAIPGAAFSVHGCHTDEGGDLFAVELAEFRQFAEQSVGEHFTDARHTGQDLGLGAPMLDLHNGFVDLFGDSLDLRFQRAQQCFDRTVQGFG